MADELLAARRAKLDRLRADGIDPFPHEFAGVEPVADVLAAHADLADGEETDARHRVAGRLAARRGQGKMAFLDLVDRSGRLQLQARVDVLGEAAHERLLGLDLGDIVGVDGTAMRTRRGELTLRVEDFTVLAKSLRPPPEKHHGLQDVETLDAAGFVEVETPILQPLYGGALARPFTTHHNALDRELYLRIATELYLKRCIVGGLERVYELGKDFRNEGLSPKHNPEFTMLEFYEAYADYRDVADRLETLVSTVAEQVGSAGEIDFSPPWRRVTLRDAILDATGIDFRAHSDRDSLAEAIGERLPTDGRTWPQLVDDLLSAVVEPTLQQPTFVLDYPVELSPFAKAHRSEPGLVERWEAFCGGVEIANAFTELNDPDEQRARFEGQARLAAEGDEDAAPYDEAFVEALEQGMPPTGGVGLGIDRLVMAFTGRPSIREVVLFPAMREV
jgi:lysyl-tRNA synthetase class 2